jgi:hypothetical protein
MYASFVSRLEEAVSESEEEFDDPSQDDDEVVRYERTSHHQSRRDELIKRVQAAHAHSAAAVAEDGAGESDRSAAQPRQPSSQDSNEHQEQGATATTGLRGARQDTLDTYLPSHAARARELEAASAYSFDDAAPSTLNAGRTASSGSASRARAPTQDDDNLLESESEPLAGTGRGKRKRLQSHSLANLGGRQGGGRQGGGLDLIGAFRAKQELGPDQQQGRGAPTAPGRQQTGASHAMRSHSLRPAQQSAQRRGRSGGVDLVGAFRSSAHTSQSSQPELPSQRVHTKAGTKVVPKSTPAKSHSLRRPDPASADRNRSWTAPPSFLGGPSRNLASQGTASKTFANLQHPAEATQSRLGDKKGLKGERERVIADLKSGAFASQRPAVKLHFRMLDGSALLAVASPQ